MSKDKETCKNCGFHYCEGLRLTPSQPCIWWNPIIENEELNKKKNMKTPILTLMCGLPRSGKSTWIKKNKKKSDIIICPDEIRSELFGHKFHKPAEPMIWMLTEFFVNSLMKQKLNIILDACNITSARNRWVYLAKENGYKVNLVILDTSLKICIKRNKNKKIPLDILKNMSIYFDIKRLIHPSNNIFDKITKINLT